MVNQPVAIFDIDGTFFRWQLFHELVFQLKDMGCFSEKISKKLDEVAELFAKKHGFDDCIGLVHERENEPYTGKYARFVVNNKLSLAKEYITEHSLTLENSYGIGDSSSDIEILSLVTHPIAFNPSKELLNEAQLRKWPIIIERKNIMYRLEMDQNGYKLAETRIL